MTETWQHAKEIAGLLPRNAVWSFCITNIEDDAIFNIYAPRTAWHALRVLLAIARKPDAQYLNYDGRHPSYEEYVIDGLTLSFITPEEHNDDGPDGPDHPADGTDPRARG